MTNDVRTLPVVHEEAVDPTQQEFEIRANKNLLCSLPRCIAPSKLITNHVPYIMLSLGNGGAVFFHLVCIGINPNGGLKDPRYIAHVRGVLLDKFVGR